MEKLRERYDPGDYDFYSPEEVWALVRDWKGRGRPPEGYLTKGMAQDMLNDLLADARRRPSASVPCRSSYRTPVARAMKNHITKRITTLATMMAIHFQGCCLTPSP